MIAVCLTCEANGDNTVHAASHVDYGLYSTAVLAFFKDLFFIPDTSSHTLCVVCPALSWPILHQLQDLSLKEPSVRALKQNV